MVKLEFQDLNFREIKDKVRFIFLKNYYFDVSKDELNNISDFKVGKNFIEFKKDNKAEKRFNALLVKGFNNLTNAMTGKKTIYIHKNSGIPLIGLGSIGLVDRNTSVIEVRVVTGCNLDCIYCSVDEGKSSRKIMDFVVEKDYLVDEMKRLIKFKDIDGIEAHIGTQGEPLLYEPLTDLIKDLKKIRQIKDIVIDTNGVLLTKDRVDGLVKAGLTQFSISLNAVTQKTADKIANCHYPLKRVMEIAKYAAKKANVVIAPIWLPGFNDRDIPKIIEFAKNIKAKVGIQNFLNYRFGRNPTKQMPWEEFYDKLKELEKKHCVKLLLSKEDFNIRATKKLEKPFKKGDIIKAEILFDGRLKGEKIAVAENRLISVPNCHKTGKVKLRIIRSKHNVFVGVLV